MDAFYEPDGDAFLPTDYTRGPWSREHQHAGPPSALLLRAAVRASSIADGQTVRAAFDILRPVPLDALRVHTRVLRPGRNVEQLETVLTLAEEDTELMRARVWRMRREEVPLPAELVDRMEVGDPEALEPAPRAQFFPPETAYADAIELRFVHGRWDGPGPACAWSRLKVDLVSGERVAPLEHLCVVGDAASGISAALDWRTWNFINVDFDLALQREPEGGWIQMDAITRFGSHGAGVAHGTFADLGGRVGTSTQALLVGPR